MDAFAVSIAMGIAIKSLKLHKASLIGLFFGGFQGIMPLIGWGAGITFSKYLQIAAPFIAFAILAIIGGKMLYESQKIGSKNTLEDPLRLITLFTFAIATSIDALGIGFSFSLIDVSILLPAIVISVITFTMSVIGIYLGDHFGHIFENKIEMVAGIILIGVGIKILLENIVFI